MRGRGGEKYQELEKESRKKWIEVDKNRRARKRGRKRETERGARQKSLE